jgi:hypothetical protein
MLTTVQGVYRGGRIELYVDLRARGIDETQAADLRVRLTTFEDWNNPEMDIYDRCEPAKTNQCKNDFPPRGTLK